MCEISDCTFYISVIRTVIHNEYNMYAIVYEYYFKDRYYSFLERIEY